MGSEHLEEGEYADQVQGPDHLFESAFAGDEQEGDTTNKQGKREGRVVSDDSEQTPGDGGGVSYGIDVDQQFGNEEVGRPDYPGCKDGICRGQRQEEVDGARLGARWCGWPEAGAGESKESGWKERDWEQYMERVAQGPGVGGGIFQPESCKDKAQAQGREHGEQTPREDEPSACRTEGGGQRRCDEHDQGYYEEEDSRPFGKHREAHCDSQGDGQATTGIAVRSKQQREGESGQGSLSVVEEVASRDVDNERGTDCHHRGNEARSSAGNAVPDVEDSRDKDDSEELLAGARHFQGDAEEREEEMRNKKDQGRERESWIRGESALGEAQVGLSSSQRVFVGEGGNLVQGYEVEVLKDVRQGKCGEATGRQQRRVATGPGDQLDWVQGPLPSARIGHGYILP